MFKVKGILKGSFVSYCEGEWVGAVVFISRRMRRIVGVGGKVICFVTRPDGILGVGDRGPLGV